MKPHTRYEVNGSKIVYDTIDGEVILINVETGNYYQLSDVAAEVWRCLDAGLDLAQTAGQLAVLYDGAGAAIESSLVSFFEHLAAEELIVPAPLNGEESPLPAVRPAQPDAGAPRRLYSAPVLHKHTDLQGLLLLDPIHDVDEQGWPTINPQKHPA